MILLNYCVRKKRWPLYLPTLLHQSQLPQLALLRHRPPLGQHEMLMVTLLAK
jgi:hypothetical protein